MYKRVFDCVSCKHHIHGKCGKFALLPISSVRKDESQCGIDGYEYTSPGQSALWLIPVGVTIGLFGSSNSHVMTHMFIAGFLCTSGLLTYKLPIEYVYVPLKQK